MTSFEKNTKKTVKVNVGGVYFKTSLLTLTKDPDSMLAAMPLRNTVIITN